MSRSNAQENTRSQQEGADLYEKLVDVARVTKVVKGGRRFAFAAIVVVGDGKGKVGYGTGKAKEVPEAVKKASAEAKKTMVRVSLREGRTLPHDVIGTYGAGKVVMREAPSGTGIIAGGAMRSVLEAVGAQDVVAKSIGSTNPHNILKATFDAFNRVRSPRAVAQRRGKRVGDILGGAKRAEAEKEA